MTKSSLLLFTASTYTFQNDRRRKHCCLLYSRNICAHIGSGIYYDTHTLSVCTVGGAPKVILEHSLFHATRSPFIEICLDRCLSSLFLPPISWLNCNLYCFLLREMIIAKYSLSTGMKINDNVFPFALQEGELLEKNTDWIYEWSSRPDQAPPKYEIWQLI